MRYVLSAPELSMLIPGMKNRAEVDMNVVYSDGTAFPAELAADCLVSLGVFPGKTAREMFEVERKPSVHADAAEPPFARVRNYLQGRYGLNLDARLPAHKKLPYLAGMIHYANLRRALLNEYGI